MTTDTTSTRLQITLATAEEGPAAGRSYRFDHAPDLTVLRGGLYRYRSGVLVYCGLVEKAVKRRAGRWVEGVELTQSVRRNCCI
jgi:hypothetical protein